MERNARIRERNDKNRTKKEEKKRDTELLNYILIYWFIWCFVLKLELKSTCRAANTTIPSELSTV